MRTCVVALLLAVLTPGVVFGDDVVTISSLDHDYDAVEIRTEKVAEGLYVLFGLGGIIAVSVGEQGVLIVDDMFPALQPKILEAIEAIAGKRGVDFAINTHWHFDHAEGNLAFGPSGSWIVAQSESRRKLITGAVFDTRAWLQPCLRAVFDTPKLARNPEAGLLPKGIVHLVDRAHRLRLVGCLGGAGMINWF